MQLISVNLGQLQADPNGKPGATTGIYKNPVAGAVRITPLGLENDVIVSEKHHGGPDQAVYIYGMADYDWWSQQLGRETFPGMFGDNLTISELECAGFNIGDILHVGEVTFQVTAPRIPCGTFAARMGDPQFVKKFAAAGRPGLYCRVLREGSVQAGDPVTVEKYSGETFTIAQSMSDYYEKSLPEATLRRYLNAPIAIRTRVEMEAELQKLLEGKIQL